MEEADFRRAILLSAKERQSLLEVHAILRCPPAPGTEDVPCRLEDVWSYPFGSVMLDDRVETAELVGELAARKEGLA